MTSSERNTRRERIRASLEREMDEYRAIYVGKSVYHGHYHFVIEKIRGQMALIKVTYDGKDFRRVLFDTKNSHFTCTGKMTAALLKALIIEFVPPLRHEHHWSVLERRANVFERNCREYTPELRGSTNPFI